MSEIDLHNAICGPDRILLIRIIYQTIIKSTLMKKQLVLILLLMISGISTLYAQNSADRPVQTLGGSGNGTITIGGYATGGMRLGSLDGKTAMFMGGYGGLLLGRSVMIGAGAYSLVNDYKIKEGALSNYPLSNDVFMSMNYFGPMVEVTFMSNDAIHFGMNTLVGFGNASFTSSESSILALPTSRITVIEPGLFAEFNVTEWFRVAAGGTYRFGLTSRLPGYDARSIGGLNFDLSLKFGIF